MVGLQQATEHPEKLDESGMLTAPAGHWVLLGCVSGTDLRLLVLLLLWMKAAWSDKAGRLAESLLLVA